MEIIMSLQYVSISTEYFKTIFKLIFKEIDQLPFACPLPGMEDATQTCVP